jgi:hypothetical protein
MPRREEDVVGQVAEVVAEWRLGKWLAAKGAEKPMSIFNVSTADVIQGDAAAALDEETIHRFRKYINDVQTLRGTEWAQEEWRNAYELAVFDWLQDRFDLPEYGKLLAPLQAIRLRREEETHSALLLDLERKLLPRRRKAKP